MAGGIPDEAGAGLGAAAALLLPTSVFFLSELSELVVRVHEGLPPGGSLSEDVDDRRRGAGEQVDGSPLSRREVAPGGHRPGALGRVEEGQDVGLRHEGDQQAQRHPEGDAHETIRHRAFLLVLGNGRSGEDVVVSRRAGTIDGSGRPGHRTGAKLCPVWPAVNESPFSKADREGAAAHRSSQASQVTTW